MMGAVMLCEHKKQQQNAVHGASFGTVEADGRAQNRAFPVDAGTGREAALGTRREYFHPEGGEA